jgi:hypothetical protein
VRPSTYICGWASLPDTRQPAANESASGKPTFLLVAASHTPAQAESASKILVYLYLLLLYVHLIRNH